MAGASGSSAAKPYFEEAWFEVAFLAACLGLAAALFYTLLPPADLSPETIQSVAMARLLAEGRVLDAFTRFSQAPVYPLLLSLVIQLRATTELPRLIEGFQQLNLLLYGSSIALVYAFIRRQIRKPYSFIITALYALAPSTLLMAWRVDPQMAFMVFSLGSLVTVDWSLSTESAQGGKITRGELIMCGTLIGLSILTQEIGYTLLIAFFFILIKRMGLKKSALSVSVIVLCISPFIGRDLYSVLRKPDPYIAPSAAIVQSAQKQGLIRTFQDTADNMLQAVTHHAVGDLQVSALDAKSGTSRIEMDRFPWGRWILGCLALIGLAYGLYQYTGIGSLYLATFLVTSLILFPNNGASLALILPLLMFYLYFGLMRAGEWAKRVHLPLSKIVTPALTVWILLCTATTLSGQLSDAKIDWKPTMDGHLPKVVYLSTAKAPENRLDEARSESAHRRAMSWLSEHTPQNAKVAIPRPESASLAADVAANQPALRKTFGHYDYLLEENAVPIAPAKALTASDQGLKLVYEDIPGKTRIWQIQPQMQ